MLLFFPYKLTVILYEMQGTINQSYGEVYKFRPRLT